MAINKSILRAVDMLELFSTQRELTLTEIAETMDMPLASTSDILKALLDKQMVEIANHRAKTYKIGVKCFQLGKTYLAGINIVEMAIPFMRELSDQTDNTVFLAKQVDNEIVYLNKVQSKNAAISTCQIGARAGLSVTALGKAILAYNEWLQKKVFSEPLIKITEHTITDPDVLKAQLDEVRSQEFAFDRFENDERVACVGFPIFDQRGKVEHAISISGPSLELRDIRREIELGKACAREISLRLGFARG